MTYYHQGPFLACALLCHLIQYIKLNTLLTSEKWFMVRNGPTPVRINEWNVKCDVFHYLSIIQHKIQQIQYKNINGFSTVHINNERWLLNCDKNNHI